MILKFTLIVAILLLTLSDTAKADSIVGHWFYFEKIYEGQTVVNPPDAPLQLHYDFDSNGQSHLYWWHVGQGDHCERWGQYSIQGNMLVERATIVSPGNTPGCADDPDMQSGKISQTPISFAEGNLFLDIGLSGDPFFYVWKQQDQGDQ